MAKKKTKKKKKVQSMFLTFVLAVIVIVVLTFLISSELENSKSKIVAEVNDNSITDEALELEYSRLPLEYQPLVTKDDLLQQMIDKMLLLDKADKLGIVADEDSIELELQGLRDQFLDDEEFNQILLEQKFTMEELKQRIAEQLIINELLNVSVLSDITVTAKESLDYYNNNKELFVDESGAVAKFSEVRDIIEELLTNTKSNEALDAYIAELREEAEITIPSALPRNEFTMTTEELCTKGDLPIIRVYTSSSCIKCQNSLNVLADAVDDMEVILYAWELDTGDNLMTEELEESMPKEEFDILLRYNEKAAVPSYVFGCKYVRIGNLFEDFDAESEYQEFRGILERLE